MRSCNDAACMGLSQWKQNDGVSCWKQIAFPSAHNKFLALLTEMWKKKRTPMTQKSSEGPAVEQHGTCVLFLKALLNVEQIAK